MTSNQKKLLLLAFVCIMPLLLFSQPGGGPGSGPGVPISQGLIYLLISGIIYGFRKKLKK